MSSPREHTVHGLPVEEQFGYWQGVAAGELIYLAGQVPRDGDGKPAVGSLEVKFEMTADAVTGMVERLGGTAQDLVAVQVNIMDSDMNLEPLQRLLRDRFGDVAPAGTVVPVSSLNDTAYVIEISAIARNARHEGLDMTMRTNVPAASVVERVHGFSRAVRVGDHVFVSGQLPVDEAGELLHAGDLVAQFGATLERVRDALARVDAGLNDVVMTYAFLTEQLTTADFDAFCAAHHNAFAGLNRPTGTMVYVPRLPVEGALIQFNATAVVEAR